MELINPADLQLVMKLAGLRPNKGLGQHFLIDKQALEQIVAAGHLSRQDTVLEIGPGVGTMTGLLCQLAGKVVAVEADRDLAKLLEQSPVENLQVEAVDVLEFDLGKLPAGYKVVANIPYYLTSHIFRTLLEAANPPAEIVLLIQKEVAERVAAKPGKMSVLGLSVQYYAQVEIIDVVERHKFWPAPKVDSAIVRLERRDKPAFEADARKLFRLIKAGFGERRKKLKNALAGGLNVTSDYAAQLLHAAKIRAEARAQELSLGEWQRLYKVCEKLNLL